MYSNRLANSSTLDGFKLDGMMMPYSLFAPRLYNLCLSLNFSAGKIMPSRAFCSDESQGYPTILLAKHFGAFPFDHGRVGGVVAVGRHGPHAHHGKDLLLIQASHVGYDSATKQFGKYQRYQTEGDHKSTNCGKIMGTLHWYQQELTLAKTSLFLEQSGNTRFITIDTELERRDREQGLILHLDKLIGETPQIDALHSTATRYVASPELIERIGKQAWIAEKRISIGAHLKPELFYFKHRILEDNEGHQFLEYNLINAMPWILSDDHVALAAAKVNTQVEFDRTYRSILREPEYQGRNFLFIAGIHIDISPEKNQIFPLTKFIPWAAYHQTSEGESRIIEQAEIYQLLSAQSEHNSDSIDLEAAIKLTEDKQEVIISGS